jgi:hypothetical protein
MLTEESAANIYRLVSKLRGRQKVLAAVTVAAVILGKANRRSA